MTHTTEINYREKVGRYIGDLVYGANDGIITTFAVVAGVAGANLETKIVIILGIANLVADGFSMASSNYLARKSENEFKETQGAGAETIDQPVKSAIATFSAFVIAGAVPLLPYFFFHTSAHIFLYAIIATSLALFVVGSLRARIIGITWWIAGFEMLSVGALAAAVAFFIGKLLESVV